MRMSIIAATRLRLTALVRAFIDRVTADGGIVEAAKCIGQNTASLAMQPSGYKARRLYSQKPVPVYGSELVTNGDFATDSDWSKGTGWSIANGTANAIKQNTFSNLSQNNVLQSGKIYLVKYTISNYVEGSIQPLAGGQSIVGDGSISQGNGIYTEKINSDGTIFYIRSRFFTGSIDNVSVKEVLTSSGDFTVDRNSTATRVNSLGLIESVAANVPRLDYTDGNCPSLLLEPQGTNLLTHSNNFLDSIWGKSSTLITANASISPDGTLNAFNLNNTSGNASCTHTLGSQPAGTYVFSVFIKATGSDIGKGIGIRFQSNTFAQNNFITSSEWQRISVTMTTTSASVLNPRILVFGVTNAITDVLIFGAQLEQSSVATSYIPTSGTTVTRLADVVDGAGDVNTFNSTEGVLYAEIAALSQSTPTGKLTLYGGSSSNRVQIWYNHTVGTLRFLISSSTGLNYIFAFTPTDITSYNKIAVLWKNGSQKVFLNGSLLNQGTQNFTFSNNSLNELSFNESGTSNVFGKTKDLRVYNTALTDAELTELTTL
jgi:hypothetical protein